MTAAAEAAGVSERTAALARRCREQGEAGLLDRSSRPRRIADATGAGDASRRSGAARLRMTAAEIAECLGLALSTVSAWLKRIGLGKRSRLEPPEPPNRYERRQPGELVHVDIKSSGGSQARRRPPCRSPQQPGRSSRPGRRAAPLGVRPRDGRRPLPAGLRRGARGGRTARRAIAFLGRAVALFAEHGVEVERGHDGQRLRLRAHTHRESPADARPAPPAHPARPATHQRQGLCLSVGVPSGWAARLPAPGGLTQAKGMSGCWGGPGRGRPSRVPLTCVRFVGRRAAGGPAKLT